MKQIEVPYFLEGNEYRGNLILPEGNEPHPCILIFHAWMGKDSFVLGKGEHIVETLGVAAFCADLYGGGRVITNTEEATALMRPLFLDREELRKRVLAAFNTVSTQTLVKKENLGAIGFCFGGLAAIELFRSGAKVNGVVSFHALLGTQLGGQNAKTVPIASNIKGSILALNGYLDPLVSQEDIKNFEQEMHQASVDWQLHIYGNAYHAFTNPDAHDEAKGLVYNYHIADRAFKSMGHFFMNHL